MFINEMKTVFQKKEEKSGVHKRDENHFSERGREKCVRKQDENHFSKEREKK
ncbi:hypothetical protein BACSP_02888 [Bacillus sp. T2.9-1]|nr:hypothetical protein BACSP_02888 [Bacillus sp. T2.9-1]